MFYPAALSRCSLSCCGCGSQGLMNIDVYKRQVKGITSDLFNATFVRAITELCHDVGKKVCLEGVETKEEYDVVKNSGLELIQGFYFGYPINAEMFEKQWL